MKKHKYNNVLKFVHLDGIKEFKETDPSLFSDDGIGTVTLEVDNGKQILVSIDDAINACTLFLNNELTSFQLQQWAEWIHMIDFFDIYSENDDDTFLLDVITDIDMLDTVEECKQKVYIQNIKTMLILHQNQ